MKVFYSSAILVLAFASLTGCGGKGPVKTESVAPADSITVSDTGYTGIKKYMSGRFLVKEITFKNGVKEGLMKTYYVTGELRHTFWFENGLREDSSIWYYQEGQKFRVTPFIRDTVDGIQKQYYREGRLKAKIGYSKGLRTPFFQEFTPDGKLVSGYPSLVVSTEDNYKTKGTFKIDIALSNKSTNVRYWRGEFSNGLFDTLRCEKLKNVKGIGTIDLKKTGSPKPAYVGVVAEVLTNFGNNLLIYKKIELPYKDLK